MIIRSEREQKDAAFIRDCEAWPRWPILPVVGRNDRQQSGFIHCGDLTRVYHLNVFDLPDRPGDSFKEQVAGVKGDRFASIEELVSVWAVD